MQPPSKFSQRKVVIPIAIAALLLFGLLAAYLMRPTDSEGASTNTGTVTTEQSADSSEATLEYKDGTYAAVGDYTSPGGSESIDVSLTIKDSVVTDATVTAKAVNPNSKEYQAKFISGYKAEVVGKSLAQLQLGAVAGSSLTPKGFNDALADIKTQAAS